MKTWIQWCFAGLVFSLGAAQAAYPDKPNKIVVAFPPGCSTDIVARALSQPFSEAMDQPVVIEYKAMNEGFAAQSLETVRMDRSTLDTYISSEAKKWGQVVQQTGAKVD